MKRSCVGFDKLSRVPGEMRLTAHEDKTMPGNGIRGASGFIRRVAAADKSLKFGDGPSKTTQDTNTSGPLARSGKERTTF
ncbi:hypothetical protein GN956_G15991 [Arapaima gigas]